MTDFKTVSPYTLPDNPFSLIGEQWALITAADGDGCNTMTASWGGVGVLWNKPVATVYIRPQRYTYPLVEAADTYSLSFLPESYRDALRYCGSHSGRDGDKLAAAGLHALDVNGTPAIAEARLILVCRKLHTVNLHPDQFIDKTLLSHYKANDFHRQYIGEITKVLVKG